MKNPKGNKTRLILIISAIAVCLAAVVIVVLVGGGLVLQPWTWFSAAASTPTPHIAVGLATSAGPAAPTPGRQQFDSAPPMTIEVARQYFATVQMAKGGEFVIQLYPDKAPITVNSFVFLATEGYFNDTTFHRVLQGFMAQGGDPTGTGMGGPGYQFVNEPNDLLFDKPGVVAMANAGPDTNGSQFFITFAAADWLNGGYTIFGQVVSGMDVVDNITLRDPDQHPNFPGDAILTITITVQ